MIWSDFQSCRTAMSAGRVQTPSFSPAWRKRAASVGQLASTSGGSTSKSGRYMPPRGSSPPWPQTITPCPSACFSTGITWSQNALTPRAGRIAGPAMEAVRIAGRDGLLAVVEVVGGDPAVVGLVADRAEGLLEVLAVGHQEVLPVAIGADAELQVEGPRPRAGTGATTK